MEEKMHSNISTSENAQKGFSDEFTFLGNGTLKPYWEDEVLPCFLHIFSIF
jgi:hypothetical protein